MAVVADLLSVSRLGERRLSAVTCHRKVVSLYNGGGSLVRIRFQHNASKKYALGLSVRVGIDGNPVAPRRHDRPAPHLPARPPRIRTRYTGKQDICGLLGQFMKDTRSGRVHGLYAGAAEILYPSSVLARNRRGRLHRVARRPAGPAGRRGCTSVRSVTIAVAPIVSRDAAAGGAVAAYARHRVNLSRARAGGTGNYRWLSA